jgi:hypothetical protein
VKFGHFTEILLLHDHSTLLLFSSGILFPVHPPGQLHSMGQHLSIRFVNIMLDGKLPIGLDDDRAVASTMTINGQEEIPDRTDARCAPAHGEPVMRSHLLPPVDPGWVAHGTGGRFLQGDPVAFPATG